MAPKRCPGCHTPIAATEDWCTPCDLRMPESLRDEVVRADWAHRAAIAAALTWLGEHPHATDREIQDGPERKKAA